MIIISNFPFNFISFCVSFAKLLSLGVLFSTTVRALVVAKLVKLGTLHLTSFILALKAH